MAFEPPIGVYQNQPTNINSLNTHRFRVVLQRSPGIEYFVQECNLPAIGMGNATQPTPFVDIPVPGDKIRFEDFVMSFPVDEDYKNYKEIQSWMYGLGFPNQFGQYKELYDSTFKPTCDISLFVFSSAQNSSPKMMINFINAFPTYLSQIQFDTKATDSVIPMVSATFKYTYWEFGDAPDYVITPADRLHGA